MQRAIVHKEWQSISIEDTFVALKTNKDGLTEKEALARLSIFGPNQFRQTVRRTIWQLLFDQFKSPLVLILLIAGLATLLLGEYPDALVIAIVVVLNAGIGLYQEGRAETAFETLRSSQQHTALVIREGNKRRIPSHELVPGDVIELDSGDAIPADARLFEAEELKTSEAALTGEWIAVSKQTATRIEAKRITDFDNMVFMGTLAAAGVGRAVVVRTGNDTEVGAIADELQQGLSAPTAFQKNIKRLARQLGIVIAVVTVVIFAAGLFQGESLEEMLLLSIAIAVAAIPSGLPIAVTVVLALGLESILRRGGLIKNLVATETLGSTTVIVTDKTGTLTQAKMSVGTIITSQMLARDHAKALEIGVLASDAFVERRTSAVDPKAPVSDELSEWQVEGRPVERAIVLAGLEAGMQQKDLWHKYTELDFSPFTSSKRYAARLYAEGAVHMAAISGAPELLLESASHILEEGKAIPLTEKTRKRLSAEHNKTAQEGVRFVAVSYKKYKEAIKHIDHDDVLEDSVFVGFVGLHDPLRLDVKESIATSQSAGARVIMATGDFAGTALRIAQEVGIAKTGDEAITGEYFESLKPEERAEIVKTHSVFARMLPDQKLMLLRILQGQGEIVAMTGDGINDAPALVNADIGIALGSGTEVAKEAADLVLLTDSFSVVVDAIKEGRRILDNLKKIVTYLLSTAFGEVIVVGSSFILGLPIPILPTQILWTNVIEEGFMTVAFAFEPAEPDIMKRNPRALHARTVLTPHLRKFVASVAGITGIFLVILYVYLLNSGEYALDHIRTIMFAALTIDSVFYTFSLKHLHTPLWHTNIFTNRYLLFAFAASLGGLLLSLFFVPLRELLSLVALAPHEYALVFAVGLFNLIVIELAKYFIATDS